MRASALGSDTPDLLQRYLADVRRHPVLPPDEQRGLALRAQAGDGRARERLVTSNLRLVVKIALELRRAGQSALDLVQQGNLGLLHAVGKFDPHRGVRFSTYAALWIRAYVLRWQIHDVRLVKFGTTQAQRRLFFVLAREKARLADQGIEPTAGAVGRALDVDAADVEEAEVRLGMAEVRDGLASLREESDPADEAIATLRSRAAVDTALEAFAEGLGPRERTILDERLLAEEPLTLEAIGRRFGISRERTRQIEKRLVRRLRERFERVRAEDADARRCTACDSSRTRHLCTCGRAWPRREAA